MTVGIMDAPIEVQLLGVIHVFHHKASSTGASLAYTNVQMTGYRWFMGSEDDTFVTGFKATGPTGKEVSGAVCSGLIGKGATVRFD